MFKDISFIMASNRPYIEFAKNFVDSIYNIKTKYNFEIVICHPEKIEDERIKWIKDDKCIGSSYAFDLALKSSIGKYISVCVDDAVVIGNIFDSIDFLESELFSNRRFKITTLAGGMTDELTKPEPHPTYPTYLHKTNNYTNFPDCNVMCFPIVLKETIEKELGGFLFHPRIKICHDWWLGAFLAFNDEMGIQFNHAKFLIRPNNNEFKLDPILNHNYPRFFGESYVNTYRLMKNYKKGMPYVYDNESDYLSEEQILNFKG